MRQMTFSLLAAVSVVGLMSGSAVAAPDKAEPAIAEGTKCVASNGGDAPELIAALRADGVEFVRATLATGKDLSEVIGSMIKLDPTLLISLEAEKKPPMGILVETVGEQADAIARGLALAARDCIGGGHSDVALAIQKFVVAQSNDKFVEAFTLASADVATSAIGSGGGSFQSPALGDSGTVGGSNLFGAQVQNNAPAPARTPAVYPGRTRTYGESVSGTRLGGS